MISVYPNPSPITVAVALDISLNDAKQVLSDMETAGEENRKAGVSHYAGDYTALLYIAYGCEPTLTVDDRDEATRNEVEFVGD